MIELFLKLLNMSIVASWIILVLLVLRPLLKKAPRWIVCFMWTIVGIRLIIPFSFESTLSLLPTTEPIPQDVLERYENIGQVSTEQESVLFVSGENEPFFSISQDKENGDESLSEISKLPPDTIKTESDSQIESASREIVTRLLSLVSIIWFLGMVVMALYALVSYLRIYTKVRSSVSVDKTAYINDEIDTPFILGIVRPRIYMPSTLSENEQKHVILHEKAHLKRLDHLWKPLGYAVLTVYWFNPLIWIAYYLLCKDIEYACDERVIKTLDASDKVTYTTVLLQCSMSRKTISACPLAFGEGKVKGRIKSILHYKKPTVWIIIVAVAMSIGTTVAFLTDPKDRDDLLSVSSPSDDDSEDIFINDESLIDSEGLEFMLDESEENYIVISIGTCRDKEIVIPATYNGKNVSKIGDNAFSSNSRIKSVVIPEGVKEIGLAAFSDCTGIRKIDLPSTITVIGNNAFDGCFYLQNIEIPEGVTKIGFGVFSGCSKLESVKIPKSVILIDHYAFSDCKSLSDIELPNAMKSIGSHAFENCISLQGLVIPEGVTQIPYYGFFGCTALKSISIPDGVTKIDDYAFSKCSSIKNISLPDAVKYIGSGVFSECSSLKDITIPATVSFIGNHAFCNCTSLKNVVLPAGIAEVASHTFYGCTSLKNVVIPDSVTSIGEYAFHECAALTNVSIPAGVTVIGEASFLGCKSLTKLTVDNKNSTYYSYQNCLIQKDKQILLTGCKNSIIPEGVTKIAAHAFQDCVDLVTIEIPDSVSEIGEHAFSGCSNLKKIDLGCVQKIGNQSFMNCRSLSEINLPDTIQEFGYWTFMGCSSLESIVIPSGITYIPPSAFYECVNLKNVVIPDTVVKIDGGAFGKCVSLKSIVIPSSVMTISGLPFQDCTSLEAVYCEAESRPEGWYANWCPHTFGEPYISHWADEWEYIDGVPTLN